MPRIVIKLQEPREEHTLELDGRPVLVGRAPSHEALRALVTDAPASTEPVQLSAPSVSANHLLAWSEADEIFVRDLSRNGTWLLLPRGEAVRAGAGSAELQLSAPGPRSEVVGDPAPPAWGRRKEFADAVADSVRHWPPLQNFDVEVRLTRREARGLAAAIPLASGEVLELIPRATTDASWSKLVEWLWRWVEQQNAHFESEQQARAEGMILASSAIRGAHREVVDAARSGAKSLLLTGPSGAGKERLAEVFHRQSGRSGPLVSVNCSMFSKDLLRSELFGAEVGSFTGATKRIEGAVERAQGGTLFLDEIGDMELELQPMLLRFLDRWEFATVGRYGKPQKADIRVVAATNKDLRAAARTGAFRSDLWYRLSVHVVDIPPLRARFEDIEAYLDSIATQSHGESLLGALAPSALEMLRAHHWEGNFRELTNLCERLPRAAGRGSIDVETCRRALERGSLSIARPSTPPAAETRIAWQALAARAIEAFVEDRGHEPLTWDEQKEWNEKYLKPQIFYAMSGATVTSAPVDPDVLAGLVSTSAARLTADRGTALKQLARYFDRFGT